MIAAQLLAAHNAAMECYRRAMLGEQTFEGRRENLSQANKLSRSYAVLLEALNGHRGKGQQKVTVEHAIPLPFDPDPAKVEAEFDKGVLHIHLPKPAEVAQKQQKIEIKKG